MRKFTGFTLLEILIALLIFSILSLILTSGLHTVIQTQSRAEVKAKRLRELQMALLILSRDIEQAIARPVTNAYGREEAAFVGESTYFTFTHTGVLQRSRYEFHKKGLYRIVWPVLDVAAESKQRPSTRRLLNGVTALRFEYLGHDGHFTSEWQGLGDHPLPRAIRVYLTLTHWGKMSQLYLVPAEVSSKGNQGVGDKK